MCSAAPATTATTTVTQSATQDRESRREREAAPSYSATTLAGSVRRGHVSQGTQLPPPPPPPPSHQGIDSVPIWARYRLPPASAASAAPSHVGMNGPTPMSSSAEPFTIGAATTSAAPATPPPQQQQCQSICTRSPPQLYPPTVEGLSAEMFDFIQSMSLAPAERAARESLRRRIEAIVERLWPSPLPPPSSVDTPSAVPLVSEAAGPAALGAQRGLGSFSTPSLASLLSSVRSSGTSSPLPAEEEEGDEAEKFAEREAEPETTKSEPSSSSTVPEIKQPAESTEEAGDASAPAAPPLSASVILFGSYALDLATPSSDLDLSIVFSGGHHANASGGGAASSATFGSAAAAPQATHSEEYLSEEELQFRRFASAGKVLAPSFAIQRLRELAEAVQRWEGPAVEVRVLEECRVPVAHIIDSLTGVSADVSINMPHMTSVVTMQRAWLAAEEQREAEEGGTCSFPPCPPAGADTLPRPPSKVRAMILLTKAALRQWGVSCSFTGGLSSTGVYLLVERFLREGRAAGCVPSPLPSLSRLLLDFWAYLSSDMFQGGYLAADVFHHSTCGRTVGMEGFHGPSFASGATSVAPSVLSSPRGVCTLDANSPEFIPTPKNLSPVTGDAPGGFPAFAQCTTFGAAPIMGSSSTNPLGQAPGGLTRTSSSVLTAAEVALLPDVTRRCTRMAEIQFLFRHSASTLEQLIAPGPRNLWAMPPTVLSAVLADPRHVAPSSALPTTQRRAGGRPPAPVPMGAAYRGKAPYREGSSEGDAGTSNHHSERSSTPGASSNGSEGAVSPAVKAISSSPVKFTSSLKDFVSAPCFVPKKLSGAPPPEYQPRF